MSEPMTPPPPGSTGGSYSPPPPPGPPAGGPPARTGLPWELSKDLGSLMETAKLLVTAPGEAFARAREKGDYGSPLIFAIIFISVLFSLAALLGLPLGILMATLIARGILNPLRRTVGMIVGQIGAGVTIEELLADYPYLEREDVLQALQYAAWLAEEREVTLASA